MKNRGTVAVLIVALAILFGILEAWQGRFLHAAMPAHQFWPEALMRTMPSWLLLAALMPLVIAFARHHRLDGPHRAQSLAALAAGGAAFVMIHLSGSALAQALRHDVPEEFHRYFMAFLYRNMVADYVLYWGLVGALHVYWHDRERRALEVAESQLRAQLAEARLGTLRAQLNPHFLFNTLNAITTLAMRGDRERLLAALDALSSLLRAALDDSRTGAWKSLAEELHFVDRYLEIQTLRFGDRLRIERDVPPEVADALVPSLLIQPLVENAIEHGVARHPGAGTVTIRAAREDLVLRIEIADTGPGFAASTAAGSGVGLANTRERLAQLFGGRATLECGDGPAGGALVRLRLPWNVSRAAVEPVAAEAVR